MTKYILVGFALVFAGFAIGAQSTDEVKLVEERCGPHVAALLSDDPQVRCNAYQDWLRQRTAQMQFLAKLADQGKARNDACDSRELAIRMLGDLKYCDHVLFRNMDWKLTGACKSFCVTPAGNVICFIRAGGPQTGSRSG